MAKNSDVNFNFTGDSSDLRAELNKVGNNLDSLSESVTGMSNDARKGLDGVAASAKKTGKAVDPISGKLKKTGGAANQAANNTRNFSEQLDEMQEAGGEASSVMGGLSGALSLISPEAGAAAQSIGDAAGGFEAIARTGTGLVAIIGPVAVAVAALGAAYVTLKGDIDSANEKLETSRDKLERVADMAHKVKESVLLAALAEAEADAAAGKANATRIESIRTRLDEMGIAQSSESVFGAHREALEAERVSIQEKIGALEESTKTQTKANEATKGAANVAAAAYQNMAVVTNEAKNQAGELKNLRQQLANNDKETETLNANEQRYIETQRDRIKETKRAAELTKKTTEAAGAHVAALEQLEAAATAAQMSQLSDRDKLIASYHAEIEAMKSTAQEHAANAEIKAALDLAAHERGKQFRQELQAFDEAAALKASELDAKLTTEKLKNQETIAADQATKNAQTIQAASDLSAASGQMFMSIAETVGKGNKAAGRRVFAVYKALALADIVLKTQQGLMTAAALPPPASGMKAAAVLIQAGLSTAVVSAQKPTFHSGSSMVRAPSGIRELNATLRDGEAVSTPLGAEILGRGAIEKANAGIGSGGSAPVVFQYEHRQFSRFIRDSVRMRGPLATETDRNKSTGHRNR